MALSLQLLQRLTFYGLLGIRNTSCVYNYMFFLTFFQLFGQSEWLAWRPCIAYWGKNVFNLFTFRLDHVSFSSSSLFLAPLNFVFFSREKWSAQCIRGFESDRKTSFFKPFYLFSGQFSRISNERSYWRALVIGLNRSCSLGPKIAHDSIFSVWENFPSRSNFFSIDASEKITCSSFVWNKPCGTK